MLDKVRTTVRIVSQARCLSLPGCVLLSAFFALSISTASAQNRPVTGAPPVPKGVNGYTVSINQDWVRGYTGFRPVRVTIETNPAKATVKDERFLVEARSRQYNIGEQLTSAELVIPAGQKSGTAEIYVNDMFSVNANLNEILVSKAGGGLLMREASSSQNAWSSHPKVLAISDDFPAQTSSKAICYSGKSVAFFDDTSRVSFGSNSTLPSFGYLSSIYDGSMTGVPGFQGMLGLEVLEEVSIASDAKLPVPTKVVSWSALKNEVGMHYSRFSDLPQSWIGLEGVDQIFISLDQFQLLTRSNELQRSNLEKWIITGGVLIVFDTGPKYKKAEKIWPLLLGADRDFVADRKKAKWRIPGSKIKMMPGLIEPTGGESLGEYGSSDEIWVSPEIIAAQKLNVSKWKQYQDPSKFPKSTPFGICDYLDGRIVAVDSDMSKWKPIDWQLLHNAIAVSGIPISSRVAVSAFDDDYRGVNFKIPGVGDPPVKMFQILIGLFLLLAGPVMIVVLKRTKQMQYLFVAVPLMSAAVCTSLFLYAIIVDGSNRWGRSQSVTHLDHQTSMAVTHSRAKYYCGTHPGKYQLPSDGLGIAYSMGTDPARVEFENGLMTLSGGNIAARIPHEVTTVRPYETTNRLLILPGKPAEEDDAESKPTMPDSAKDGDDRTDSKKGIAPQVQNRLGADVRWAMIRTPEGYFVVSDLKAGQTVVSQKAKVDEGIPIVREIVGERSPQFVGTTYQNGSFRSRNRAYSSAYGYDQFNVQYWGEDHRVTSLLRSGALSKLLDRPNTYIALMEEFPLAAEQLEPVEYKMQLHVVRGQW